VKRFLVALALSLAVPAAHAQSPRGETVTRTPEFNGERASAPIPPELHVRNEGGSDGAGLCVISSMLANGQYQKVPGLEGGKNSALWRTAKSRPGGYGPGKLINLVRETLPNEKYASFENCDEETLDRLSRQGYPIGAVMAWGQGYNGRISHMISLVHYRKGGNACVVDNNFPGEYHWMPATEEYLRRFQANGSWAFIWTRLPPIVRVAAVGLGILGGGVLLFFAAVQLGAAAVTLFFEPRPREPEPAPGPVPVFS
jgi:hypothetical protein